MLTHTEMIVRIAAGAVLGGVIGYERDLHGRHVGLRTHSIVAMAAATFMVISAHFVYFQGYGPNDLVEVDSSRIAASVVSGIGFLAGGAILRTGATVQGLTTAAGLWLVTAIGLCAGAGMFVESAVVTVMGMGALTVLRRLEDKNLVRRRIALVCGTEQGLSPALDALTKLDAVISDVEIDKRLDEPGHPVAATLSVQLPKKTRVTEIVRCLEGVGGIRRVHVMHV